ncbi:MAG: thioredoxin family protein [Alphaproteobacteria bacterium]
MMRLLANTILFFLLWIPAPALGQTAGDWQQGEHVRVRLVSGVTGTGELAEIPLGLEVELAEGWDTYWRMPGDAGAPPLFNWSADLAEDGALAQAQLLFPAPMRHMTSDLETIGYQGHVVFPLLAAPKVAGKALTLNPKLMLLTCGDICIPNDFTLHLAVPAGEAGRSEQADMLDEWRAKVPVRDASGFSVGPARLDEKGAIAMDFAAPAALENPAAFIESDAGNVFLPPQVTVGAGGRQGEIILTPRESGAQIDASKITVTLADGGRGWEQDVALPMPAAAAAAGPKTESAEAPAETPLWLILLFAIIGGAILNLMPCVLPVLSLKVLKFMGHGGREDRDARRSFLATSAGIMVSFLLMAGVVVGLRAAGQTVGWGMQFQQPDFLIFMIAVLLLFAANLWGFFEIQLPAALNDKLFGVTDHPKLLGSFLTGMFATLLATPCSAPFLGTAVGFALVADSPLTFAVFAGLGLGMSLPYLLVAAYPGLATRMPRPGIWMIWLKRVLALALLATALWLGNVLMMEQTNSQTQKFDPAAIEGLVEEGRTVFVDVTASWCVTCQVNKKLVLDQPDIAAVLSKDNVVFIQADWTKPDSVIADYLRSFGRGGIPFNVVYGPGAPQGITLPELLTKDAILEALDKAGEKP